MNRRAKKFIEEKIFEGTEQDLSILKRAFQHPALEPGTKDYIRRRLIGALGTEYSKKANTNDDKYISENFAPLIELLRHKNGG